jgi:hypothetical protein
MLLLLFYSLSASSVNIRLLIGMYYSTLALHVLLIGRCLEDNDDGFSPSVSFVRSPHFQFRVQTHVSLCSSVHEPCCIIERTGT